MADAPNQPLTALLREVSRSFYLTLRVLPGKIRPQIGVAYLLARATDTVADTEAVAVSRRLEALRALRERILGAQARPLDFGELAPRQTSSAERQLLARCEEVLSALGAMSAGDRTLIRQVLGTITSGQELDLLRFGQASLEQIVALRTDEELDDYTYRVAGCVGEFWTRICRAHLFPSDPLDEAQLLILGVRFGKGLQLVNVLRDLPADLRRGRCYVPSEQLELLKLSPQDLLEPANHTRLLPVYRRHLERAADHLHAGWDYTNTLPKRCARLRLACAWPILIGFDTLALLQSQNFLDPRARLKVSRARVRQTLLRSVLWLPWPARWRRLAPPAQKLEPGR